MVLIDNHIVMEGFKFWKNKPKAEKANDIVSLGMAGAVLVGGSMHEGPKPEIEPPTNQNQITEQMPSQSELKEIYKNEFENFMSQHGPELKISPNSITLEHIGDTGPDSTVLLTFKINNEIVPVVFNGGDGFTDQMLEFLGGKGLLRSHVEEVET